MEYAVASCNYAFCCIETYGLQPRVPQVVTAISNICATKFVHDYNSVRRDALKSRMAIIHVEWTHRTNSLCYKLLPLRSGAMEPAYWSSLEYAIFYH